MRTYQRIFDKFNELKYFKYFILFFVGFLLLGLSSIHKWFILIFILFLSFWILCDFSVSLFFVLGMAIAQGKVGIILLSPAEIIIDDIYFLEIYFPIFLVSFLINSLNNQKKIEFWNPISREIILIMFFFVLWALLCSIFTEWKIRGYIQFTHTFIFFLYFIIFSTFSKRNLYFVLKSLVVWGTIYFIMAFLCVSGIPLEFDSLSVTKMIKLKLIFFEGGKRASLLSPPEVTAATLGLCAWSAYVLGFMNRKHRYGNFFLAFLITLGIFYTRTRSEMVGFLFAGFVMVTIISWQKRYVIRGLMLCLAYVIIVWVFAAGLDLSGALKRIQISTDISERASLGIRLGLWKQGLIDIVENYGLGLGTGGFFKYRDQWPHAHNVYFSVLFDLGIVGFFLWILIFLNLWRMLILSIKRSIYFSKQWLMLVFFAAFFIELSLASLLQHEYTHFVWWLFPGLLLALLNNVLRRQNKCALA